MAKTMAAFYELPPWFEKMNQLQRQIDSLTRPLLEMQTDYAALTKTIAAVLDSPAIRDLNKVSRVFDNQSMAAIYRTQEIISKMDTSGISAALRQYQAVMDGYCSNGYADTAQRMSSRMVSYYVQGYMSNQAIDRDTDSRTDPPVIVGRGVFRHRHFRRIQSPV